MKKINYLLLILAIIAFSSCKKPKPKTRPIYSNPCPTVIVFHDTIAKLYRDELKKVVCQYNSTYGLNDTLNIFLDSLSDVENLKNGDKETVMAYATYKSIHIHTEGLSKNINTFHNTIVHELFHTIPSKKSTKIKPFTLRDGNWVVGYNGLSVKVLLKTDTTKFMLFEEAAAEVLATSCTKDYAIESPYYFHLGTLLKDIVDIEWISIDEMVECHKTNNIPYFISKILKLPEEKLTGNDIAFVMECFQNVYLEKISVEMALNQIIAKRGEVGKYEFNK